MTPKIVLNDKPDPGVAKAIASLLLDFNNRASGYAYDAKPLAITLSDPESDAIVGGLWGATGYGYLHLDLLFVPEEMRGAGMGSHLINMAEEEAIRRGCRGAWLDTFSFQARTFYEKLGYAVAGELADCPPGHTRFFMKKVFAPAG
jgi:GNAT superfamily N-acetyltransferase